MAKELAQHFVRHRGVRLAPNVIAELRFDYRESAFDVCALVIMLQERLMPPLVVEKRPLPKRSGFARNAVALEGNVGRPVGRPLRDNGGIRRRRGAAMVPFAHQSGRKDVLAHSVGEGKIVATARQAIAKGAAVDLANALKWKSAISAMIRRAGELGILSESQKESLLITLGRKGWRHREPFDTDVKPEQPQ